MAGYWILLIVLAIAYFSINLTILLGEFTYHREKGSPLKKSELALLFFFGLPMMALVVICNAKNSLG